MNSDLERAISSLEGHTIFLVKGSKTLSSDKRGVAPMLDFLEQNTDLEGWSVADRTVGKAAAFLFIKARVSAVFAYVMSKTAKEMLEKSGIEVQYSRLTDVILNRTETDLCPMEKATRDIENVDEAYIVIKQTYKALTSK